MSDKVIQVYKKCGETPLECINTLKNDNPNLRFLPMTYAGRLDPLAEGILLILVGDECHKKDEYLALSKEYEVEILFGFATDTYDVLGKVLQDITSSTEAFELHSSQKKSLKELFDFSDFQISSPEYKKSENSFMIEKTLTQFVGRIKQSYPAYSSRTVNGKPLFVWAREGKLNEIEIPSHDVYVENINIINSTFILGDKLLFKIKDNISKVKGDFRQEEILSIWENELNDKKEEKYQIIKLRISCGSGVYVRGIADELGKKLGISSLALNIKRTKIGNYTND